MIEFLRGVLVRKDPTAVVIDVHGVGYGAFVTLSTFERLPEVGTEVALVTYLHVREDAMLLYAFIDEAERYMFRELLSITGIGARMAMGILSGSGAEALRMHVAAGDVAALTRIPGVGKKTAERILVELRDRINRLHTGASGVMASAPSMREEALLALQALGYARAQAEKALAKAEAALPGDRVTTSELIRATLPHLS
jgi:holliday junction DNA helicase RuvA